MLKFHEWYQTKCPRQPIHAYEKEIKLGWDGCKEEILKILKEKSKGQIRLGYDDRLIMFNLEEFIKEITKL